MDPLVIFFRVQPGRVINKSGEPRRSRTTYDITGDPRRRELKPI